MNEYVSKFELVEKSGEQICSEQISQQASEKVSNKW